MNYSHGRFLLSREGSSTYSFLQFFSILNILFKSRWKVKMRKNELNFIKYLMKILKGNFLAHLLIYLEKSTFSPFFFLRKKLRNLPFFIANNEQFSLFSRLAHLLISLEKSSFSNFLYSIKTCKIFHFHSK